MGFLEKWGDKPQQTPQGDSFLEDLLNRVKNDPALEAKVISGALPVDTVMKVIDIASERFKQPIKQAIEPTMQQISNAPMVNEAQRNLILSKGIPSVADIGQAVGGMVSPRQIADVGVDIAIDPRTYLYGYAGKMAQAEAVAGRIAPKAEAVNTPVSRITQALKEAAPIRKGQEAIYSAERARRAGAVAGIGKEIAGEAGYKAQLGALKGEMPKVQFEGLRSKITQPDIDSLFNSIEQHPILQPFDKITAKTGLAKLLGAEGGSVPTQGELKLLGEIFPREFVDIVLSKRPLMQKLGEGAAEVLNVPRALMASFDMSAPLRQGVFLIGRPKQWIPAAGNMFKYFFSEKSYQGLMEGIKQRPTYALMKEANVPLTEIGATLTGREEAFMSNLAEKIPVAGRVVRASNRAYTGFLNKLRADVFDDLVKTAQKQGIKVEGKVLTDIGNFVGAATGRGKLPAALEKSAVALNSVLFSPRLMASRLNLLNPVYYTKLDPFVRKEALKSLLSFGGTAASVITLAKMGGADIGADPRSADFGKIKIGNTRYDILGGFQQYLRAMAQLITGKHVSSTTGVETTLGEGYKPLTRLEIMTRFIESKESPVASFVTTLLKGQDPIGKKVDLRSEVSQRFIPMVLQDMADLQKERGLEGIAMSIPAFFGVGLQTYSPTPEELVHSANSVIKHSKDLMKQGKIAEAEKLMAQNKDVIGLGKHFEPMQKTVNAYEKLRKAAEENVRLTPQERKRLINEYTNKIKYFNTFMTNQLKERQNRDHFTTWQKANVPAKESSFLRKWGK